MTDIIQMDLDKIPAPKREKPPEFPKAVAFIEQYDSEAKRYKGKFYFTIRVIREAGSNGDRVAQSCDAYTKPAFAYTALRAIGFKGMIVLPDGSC